MKNTKAILLIVLGSFIIATGFAFAETSRSPIAQLNEAAGNLATPVPSNPSAGTSRDVVTTAPAPAVVPPAVPAPTAVAAAPAEKKLTAGEKVKKFIGDNFSQIVTATAIGLIAFLVVGTGGAGLLIGLAAFAFFTLLKHL